MDFGMPYSREWAGSLDSLGVAEAQCLSLVPGYSHMLTPSE